MALPIINVTTTIVANIAPRRLTLRMLASKKADPVVGHAGSCHRATGDGRREYAARGSLELRRELTLARAVRAARDRRSAAGTAVCLRTHALAAIRSRCGRFADPVTQATASVSD